jgi:hypothetical protein
VAENKRDMHIDKAHPGEPSLKQDRWIEDETRYTTRMQDMGVMICTRLGAQNVGI